MLLWLGWQRTQLALSARSVAGSEPVAKLGLLRVPGACRWLGSGWGGGSWPHASARARHWGPGRAQPGLCQPGVPWARGDRREMPPAHKARPERQPAG